MPADLTALLDDLSAESDELGAVLDRLADAQWALPTPAQGWTIADQVSHLAYFDDTTRQSLIDPDAFRRDAAALTEAGDAFPDRIAARYHDTPPARLRGWLHDSRTALLAAYREVDPARRLPWYGPPMSPASSVTARLMETWAHGQDIRDTLGLTQVPTARLRHVAHIGVRALPYSYAVRNLPQPSEPIRVQLSAPDGQLWTWGPADAADVVSGEALDFCLVVTQRRHVSDTALVITGETARGWIAIAQAFAGAAGPGRPPAGDLAGGPQ